jgi:DNA-binding MarR family transcriptional regulator
MIMSVDDFITELGVPVLPHHLRRLVDRLMAESQEIANRTGIKSPLRSSSMMRLLQEHGPFGVVEISQRLGLSHPLIIQFEKVLTERGLVHSTKNPADQRSRLLALTKAGEKEAKQIRKNYERIGKIYAELSAEIGVDLYEIVQKTNQALDRKNVVARYDNQAENEETKV